MAQMLLLHSLNVTAQGQRGGHVRDCVRCARGRFVYNRLRGRAHVAYVLVLRPVPPSLPTFLPLPFFVLRLSFPPLVV